MKQWVCQPILFIKIKQLPAQVFDTLILILQQYYTTLYEVNTTLKNNDIYKGVKTIKKIVFEALEYICEINSDRLYD